MDNWQNILRDKIISFRDNEKQVRISSGSVFIALDLHFVHFFFWLFLTLLIDYRFKRDFVPSVILLFQETWGDHMEPGWSHVLLLFSPTCLK